MQDDIQEKKPKESLADIYHFVEQQLKLGIGESAVVSLLEEKGMSRFQATKVVNSVRERVYGVSSASIEPEAGGGLSLILVIVGGIVGAVIGGVAWGLVVVWTKYEIGYLAMGIGALVAFSIRLLSRGQGGIASQIIAVVCAFLGVVIGKYFTCYSFMKDAIFGEYGAEATEGMSFFSSDVFASFLSNPQAVFGLYDVLWVGLAVYVAFRYSSAHADEGS